MMKTPGMCDYGICREVATDAVTQHSTQRDRHCCKLHADMIRNDGREAWSIYAYVAPKRKGKAKKSLRGQNLPQVGIDRRYTYEDALELFTAWCESGQYVRVSIAHYPPRSSCGYLRNDWYKEQ